MSERLHKRDHISRLISSLGFLFLFIISYAIPAFHSFLDQENHTIEISSCYVIDKENQEVLSNSNHDTECSHTNHLANASEKCDLCAYILSLRITLISCCEEEGNLFCFVQKSGLEGDEKCETLIELTKESRGPPLVF